ncbi:hypothetical protein K440DRAFT_625218 [Wilcoxina mikolae CBS 423.85]|nr:hypothetical protein K440DRAFT_625218 [Wilcoxina mikolae CBS 423.85]
MARSKVASIIAACIPPILLIISFAFILKTIYTPSFAESQALAGEEVTRVRTPNYRLRSPFHTCNEPVIDSKAPTAYVPVDCTRTSALGNKLFQQCLLSTSSLNDHQCQQVSIAANLMVAAAVFIGISMGVSFALPVLAALDTPRKRDARSTARSSTNQVLLVVLLLLVLIGSGLMLLGQIVGVNALVNDAAPNGEWLLNGTVSDMRFASWTMGRASLVYATVGWFAGYLAAFVLHCQAWIL